MPTPAPPTTALPAAVLWDLDGTLIDSEPYWMAAERAVVEAYGGTWTVRDAADLVGAPLPVVGRRLHDHGVDLDPEVIVAELVTVMAARLREQVPWQPGAPELLLALRGVSVPSAMVTMSYRVLADAVLAASPPGAFAAVVCGDDVTHGKPHPEPYLLAAEMLGVDPARCVAVEDSLPGLGSAHAAGARVVGVQHGIVVESAPGRTRISSLEQLDLGLLGRIAAGESFDLLAV